MPNKSNWITLAAFLMVMVLAITACAQVAQVTPAGADPGQGEPAPEEPVEAPPEEKPVEEPPAEAPVEEPAAPAPDQAPAGNTGNVTTSQGSQTGVVIVLLLILVMIGVGILIVAGRGSQSQPQTPAAEAPATPPTPVDDSETNDYQSP